MKRQKQQQVSFIPQNISNISPQNDKIALQQSQTFINAQNVFYNQNNVKGSRNNLQISREIVERQILQINSKNININQKDDYQIDQKDDYLINQIGNHVRQIFSLKDQQKQQTQYYRKRVLLNPKQNANHNNLDKYHQNLSIPYRRIQTQVIQQKQQCVQQEQQNYQQLLYSNNISYKNQNIFDQSIRQAIITQTLLKQKLQQAISRQQLHQQTINQEQLVLDYSDNEVEWLQNHYKSNIKHLSTLTTDLIKQIQGLLIQTQNREVRKKIIQLQLQTNKLKISLRKSPQTKHINYSLDLKYNKLNFIKVAKKVDNQLRLKCEELQQYLNHRNDEFNQSQKYLQALQLYQKQFSKKINYKNIAQNHKIDQQISHYYYEKKQIQDSNLKKKQIQNSNSKKIIKLKDSRIIKNRLSNYQNSKNKLKSLNLVANQSHTSLGNSLKTYQNINMRDENFNDYGFQANAISKNQKPKKFYYKCQKQKILKQNQTYSSKQILSIKSQHHQLHLTQRSRDLKQQILNIQVENNSKYKTLEQQNQLLRLQLFDIEQKMIKQYGRSLEVNCLTKKNQLKFAQVTFSGLENTVKSPLKINKIQQSIASMKQIRPSKKLYTKIRTELNLIQGSKIRQSNQLDPEYQYAINRQKQMTNLQAQITKKKQIGVVKSPLILKNNIDRSQSQRIINRFKKQKLSKRISFIPSSKTKKKVDQIMAQFQNLMEQNSSKIHSKETTLSHNDYLINQ